MKLPNGDRAVVDGRKLVHYVLSPDHLRGRHKAKVFKSALNITAEDADELQQALLYAAATADGYLAERDAFGQRYIIDFDLVRQNGQTAHVRSAWIIRDDEDFPRFVTCYVL